MGMSDRKLPRQRSYDSVCLRCRRLDQLVSVPAAVRAGHSTGVVRGSVTGRFGYDVPVSGRVVQVSGLARALAAPRRPRAATGPAIVFGGSVLLAMWNLLLAVSDPADGTAWFGTVFFLAVAAGSGWVLRARQRRLQVMGPLADEAVGLWRRSWYCRRCGVVSVYGAGMPVTVPAGSLASALISVAQQRRQQPAQSVRSPSAGVSQ
ncbi:hypothetical protein GCM10010172_30020 [Paractinoplanes ferrugineus]|uniref:Uncharacterized protein n=1 Tax=Paractinoplanes ferrugineus TaxID=113564 RepID=A0A919MHA8_9ACTN|nr:hypothetical protein Afe05nite_74730 [Actinoplanes ferrugineus]